MKKDLVTPRYLEPALANLLPDLEVNEKKITMSRITNCIVKIFPSQHTIEQKRAAARTFWFCRLGLFWMNLTVKYHQKE